MKNTFILILGSLLSAIIAFALSYIIPPKQSVLSNLIPSIGGGIGFFIVFYYRSKRKKLNSNKNPTA